jgi:3-hydroxybutyryl-CoA dehydrogenase
MQEKRLAERELRRIGIVGAGAMGRGIAQVCSAAGCAVRLFDASQDAVGRAIDTVRDDLARTVEKQKLTQEAADATLDRIQAGCQLSDMADCDLVVEAIVENLEVKQQLLRNLESLVRPDCILATNTSSLSVTAIAAACERPERVAGWHFFNPVPRMRLVEVIQAPRTRQDVVDALVQLSQRVGHKAVVASDTPGFVVNHAGRAYVTEGLKLLAERAAEHSVLDAILRDCAGFRMGPFELLDLTGLDVSQPVMESIHAQYYGDDRYRPVPLARTRMVAGLLGRKSGQGFYRYDGGKAEVQRQPAVDDTLPAQPWWPVDGPAAPSEAVTALLAPQARAADAAHAEVILLCPLGPDLSTAAAELRLDATRCVAVDPLFASRQGVTLMGCPATTASAMTAARAAFEAEGIATHVVADSPGYVAPRVVACIVNLASDMAQQGIASPADIDASVRLGLGYPCGPFEWGDRLGALRVLQILQGLHATFGDQRYRPSPWLVRRARLGLPLSTPDRSA